MSFYINEKVSGKKLENLLWREINEAQTEIHSLVMYKDNELMINIGLEPYTSVDQRQIFSLSKSFAATAIGIACDRGLLSVNDKVIDIFPEKAPKNPDKFLKQLTVHHLLTMNTGHEACTMYKISQSNDGVSEFFAQPIAYEPGTHFTYNTGATFMLSAIITKLTGQTLYDFLCENFFCHIGVIPKKWMQCGGGISEGGVGLFVSCEDVAKLGLLYLNNGMYNGKRLLSEEWVKTAQLPHSDNSGNGTPDWTSGYGYQLWMNAQEGYRGDGAIGQYFLVIPEKNIVLATLAESFNMQNEISVLFDFINDFEGDDKFESTPDAFYPPASYKDVPVKLDGFYKLKENAQGFTTAMIKCDKDKIRIDFTDGFDRKTIIAGNGKWIKNHFRVAAWVPTLIDLMEEKRKEEATFAASCKVEDENTVIMDIRYLNYPYKGTYTIKFDGNSFDFTLSHLDGSLYPDATVIHGDKII